VYQTGRFRGHFLASAFCVQPGEGSGRRGGKAEKGEDGRQGRERRGVEGRGGEGR
jgi:hypothetical protein